MEVIEINKKAGRAVKWSTGTEVFSKCISPITNIILARLLVPEMFGIVTTINMIISFADMFTDAGFQKYLVQHEFIDEDHKNKSTNVAFWTNLTISVFLWGLIIILRNPIATMVGNPGLGDVIAIACVQLILTSFSSIQMALYKREFDFKTLFFVRIVISLIPLAVTVPLAFIWRSYWALIIGSICGALANAIFLTAKSKWKPYLYYNFSLLKEMFAFSFWSLLEAIAIWFTLWVDALIIGIAFDAYYLGLYKNSLNMVNALVILIRTSIVPVLFSVLSRLQNNEEQFQKTFYKVQKLTAYIAFPAGIGLFIFSDLATYILFGSKWAEAGDIVGIWSLMAFTGLIFSNFNGEVYRAKGRPKLSFSYQVIHLCFLIPVCLITMQYGFWPLVYGRSLIRLQGTVFYFIFMSVFMGFSVKDMASNVIKPLIFALLMGALGFALHQISPSHLWSFISIAICVLFYGLLLMKFSKKDLNAALKIIKRK